MTTPNKSRRHFLASAGTLAAASLSGRADDTPPLKVGVIGHTGRGNFGHGLDTVWTKVPTTTIVAVSDPDENGRAKAVKHLGLNEGAGFSSYQEMLEQASPDIVAVCPRHADQHHAMIMASIKAGVRGIYVEKPFCRDLVEADEIVEACAKNHTKLAIAHRNRYHPILPVVKKLIADGEALGRVLEIRIRGKEDRRGGAEDLWVLGSHLLNLTNYFAGSPTSCSASIRQDGQLVTKEHVIEGAEGLGPLAGNEIHARYETESNVPVFFDSVQNAGSKGAGFGIQIIGTEGIIDFRADKNPLAHFMKGNPFHPTKEARTWIPVTAEMAGLPPIDEAISGQVMSHIAAANDLVECIGTDRKPLCNELEGRVVTEMILGVFASHKLNGQRVEIPLKERRNALALL